MSFSQRVATAPVRRIRPCAVREVLELLPPAEAEAARKMLSEPVKERSHVELASDFTEEGYPLSDSTIGKHRRLACSCRFLAEQ